MGNTLKSVVFLPPFRNIEPKENDFYLTTKHNSKILVKEIDIYQSDIYVIFSHGNAEDIFSSYDWCYNYLLKSVRVNVIIYEYTGYNTHDDKRVSKEDSMHNHKPFSCEEQYLYNDIEAVYEYLTKVKCIPPNKIIAIGRSLGTGPSCYLAEKYKIGGLIINSAFTSILRVAFNFRYTFFFDMFPNIDRIGKIKNPILLLHSIKDEIVPFEHAVELYEKCDPKYAYDPLFVDGTTHNNIDKICEKVFDQINDFLESIYGRKYRRVSKINENYGVSWDSKIEK